MTRKRSKCLFVIFSIILVVCLLACFVNFTYPLSVGGNYQAYSSFAKNVRFGEDIGDSYRIVYRADLPENELESNYNSLRTSTINSLREILTSEGYKDTTVTELGENQIMLQIGDILTYSDINTISSLIGNPQSISFSLNSDGSEPFADRNSIKNIYATQSRDQSTGSLYFYGVVEFKDNLIDEISSKVEDKTIYIFLGENQFGSSSMTNNVVTLYSSSFISLNDAQTIVNRVKTGTLSLELTQIEAGQVSPSYGVGGYIYAWVIMCVFVLLTLIFLIVRYREAGWLAMFGLLFYVVIALFLIQSIPAMHINFAGVVAMLISFTFVVDALINLYEKARKYYLADTKLHIAFKASFNDLWKRILFLNAVMLVFGFVCIFMPNMAIHSFGWVLFTLSFVNAFVSLVLMRLFVNMYLAINNSNGKRVNFHKGGKNA